MRQCDSLYVNVTVFLVDRSKISLTEFRYQMRSGNLVSDLSLKFHVVIAILFLKFHVLNA